MKVSELIQKLEEFKNQYGDLPVYVHSYYSECEEIETIKKD